MKHALARYMTFLLQFARRTNVHFFISGRKTLLAYNNYVLLLKTVWLFVYTTPTIFTDWSYLPLF